MVVLKPDNERRGFSKQPRGAQQVRMYPTKHGWLLSLHEVILLLRNLVKKALKSSILHYL